MNVFQKMIYRIRLLSEPIFECPCCHGKGGETDIITDEGQGPFYPCGLCDGNGKLNIFKKLYFLAVLKKWEREARKSKKLRKERRKK
jgi:hypothetical protein